MISEVIKLIVFKLDNFLETLSDKVGCDNLREKAEKKFGFRSNKIKNNLLIQKLDVNVQISVYCACIQHGFNWSTTLYEEGLNISNILRQGEEN